MAAHHYIVARSDSQWKVSFHGTEQGPFTDKDEAIAVAIASAQQRSLEGIEVEVLVQDIESNFHTAWTSSRDDGADEALSTSV